MLDIWFDADGQNKITPIMATIFRFVESQEQIATLSLVNNVYEQGVLEELLESSKSALPSQTESLHYLLKTPFRYPPLQYGSRFGSTYEPSLFYGSLSLSTALAETAYYRFVYMLGPEVSFKSTLSSEYTSFSVSIKSKRAILLDEPPFSKYEAILASPISYSETQRLGTLMRHNEVEAFRYISARDKNKGKNMGLFTPMAFHTQNPSKIMNWLCQTNIQEVGFISKENNERILFNQHDFWVDGRFPSPAT